VSGQPAPEADPFSLAGSRAVVTGASQGLGQGIAERLMRAGADVTVMQRSAPPAELTSAAARFGRSLTHVPTDLSVPEELEASARRVLDGGPADILVNNAGAQFRAPAEEFPLDRFDEILRINLRAVFRLCQLFAGPMLERGHGRVVNVASLLSFQGGITVPAYAASKGAVAQLTKALSNEWASRGVTVNAVAPGYMDTRLNEALLADPVRSRQISERIPAGRWGRPDDIGDSVVFLASPAASYITGTVLPVDGGWLGR
jgi:2-deoxy-D-gluconate 3-dehydrogenase